MKMMERSWKKSNNIEISAGCPRCGSCNTKFCYYNNYSLTQPRYFCKSCRRYWTKGGSLRNVPLGGGCRKNRRLIANKSTTSSTFRSSSNSNINNVERPNSLLNHISTDDPTSQSPDATTPPPPHIDIALVYANFLNNPNPDSRDKAHHQAARDDDENHDELLIMQKPPLFDHSLEYNKYNNVCSTPQEAGLTGYLLSNHLHHDGNTQLSHFHDIDVDVDLAGECGIFNCMAMPLSLPALPIPIPPPARHHHHMMWSHSHNNNEMMMMMANNHGLQAPSSVLGIQHHDDHADFIIPNWAEALPLP